jgi:pimeloyl-ACP methyl ester carboxylesterase
VIVAGVATVAWAPDPTAVTVTVLVTECGAQNPIPDAKVTIYEPDAILAVGYTNSAGTYSATVVLWVDPARATASISAKAEKQDYGPSQEVGRNVTLIIQTPMGNMASMGIQLCMPKTRYVDVVFLHGWGSSGQRMSVLAEEIAPRLSRSGYTIRPWIWSLPSTVGLDQWADHIRAHIASRLPQDADKIVLIGHSMGGKAAIHAVYSDQALSRRVPLIITLNTPYAALAPYQGGIEAFCKIRGDFWPGGVPADQGVCASLAYRSVAEEVVPLTLRGVTVVSFRSSRDRCLPVDLYPGLPDDGVVPIEAQTANGAVRVDYGSYCHWECLDRREVARLVADLAVPYIIRAVSGGR